MTQSYGPKVITMVAKLPNSPLEENSNNLKGSDMMFRKKNFFNLLLIVSFLTAVFNPNTSLDLSFGKNDSTATTSQVVKEETLLGKKNVNQSLGTWLWNTSEIYTSKDKVVSFVKKEKITELYLQIDKDMDFSYYKDFISELNWLGVSVYALDGAPNYINEEGKASLESFFVWVEKYQNAVSIGQKFKGIHFDVEPYILSQWNSEQTSTIGKYKNFVKSANEKAKALSMPVVFDIPFWFDEMPSYGEGENLADFVIKNSDGVNIMAYREQGSVIVEIVKNELAYGAKSGKRVIVGVETNKSSEVETVTFYEEGRSYMNKQLEIVKRKLGSKSAFSGFAIHDYNGWKGLRP